VSKLNTNLPRRLGRDFLSRTFLFMQRHSTLVPPRVRQLVRGKLNRTVILDMEPVEDWTKPLIHVTGAVPLPWSEPDRAVVADHRTPPRRRVQGGADVRCLIATETLDAGGLDEVVGFLARGLPQFGLRVAILHTPTDGASPLGRLGQVLRKEGIEIANVGRENCEAWIRAWKPDVLSVHGAPNWVLQAAATCSVPAIETLHGMHNEFNAARSEVAGRRGLLAGLVSVSEMVRRQYLAIDSSCDPASVVTIPNGVPAHRQQEMLREKARKMLGLTDEYLFLSLSRHCIQKNTYGLATAFSRVADAVPEAHLLICGRPDDTAYAGQVVGLKGKMRNGDRLHLRDHSPHPRVLLTAADGFVLDSFFEGWALSSMEALVAGVPVIVSDVGGAVEQLADRPEWGRLVSNPLGNPLEVDWESMTAARFQRQSNQDELVESMISFTRDQTADRTRGSFAAEAAERFDGALCLRRHAGVLKAAAVGEPISLAQPAR
jgi:glycosyltransferase involved in cell wall biosynthesis